MLFERDLPRDGQGAFSRCVGRIHLQPLLYRMLGYLYQYTS